MAGSVTTSGPTKLDNQVYSITYSWTADSADGSVPDTAGPAIEGMVLHAVTNPGATAPTDNYDIVLNDSDTCDVFGGELNNRHTTNTQQAMPKIGNGYGERYVKGALTMSLSNNSVNSATGILKVYFRKLW